MEWLNYHHLLYFFTVAREGGLAPAGKVLRLSPSALSGQIKRLEDNLGHALFEKRGRRLQLTETGRIAYRYAEEIFGLGGELVGAVRGHHVSARHLTVGVADVVPKILIKRLLEPALLDREVRLTCIEDSFDGLLARLGRHAVDVLITDAPMPPGTPVRAFNHLLGESAVTLLAPRTLAPGLRRGFPRGLDGASLLLPLTGTVLRRDLDAFFVANDVRPEVRAEAQDSALLKAFAAEGMGAVFAPSVIAREVASQYGLALVAEVPGLRERYYAISIERRLVHPAVVAIRAAARNDVFG